VTCRHHLRVDLPDDDLVNGPTCSLDLASVGAVSSTEIAALLGMSNDEVRTIERRALRKASDGARRLGLKRFDWDAFGAGDATDFSEQTDSNEDRRDNMRTHICVWCGSDFMSQDFSGVQRLFCGPSCRGDK
jgi:hypothetical protein